jgi:hypothetical protein
MCDKQNFFQNMFQGDDLLNSNEAEKKDRKRKRHKNRIFLNQKDNKKLDNASQQEYGIKSQNQEAQQHYSKYNKEK